jgi:WD40 repeat protein
VLRVFDSETGADLEHPLDHGSEVLGAAVSQSGSRLVSWSSDGAVRIWSLPDLKPLVGPLNHGDAVEDVATTSDGRYLISRSTSSLIVWEMDSGKRAGSEMVHEESVNGMTLSRDESKVISWSTDGALHIWDLRSGQEMTAPLNQTKKARVIGIALSKDGRRMLSWGDEFFRWWNIDFVGDDLLKIACSHVQRTKAGDDVEQYGVKLMDPICTPGFMPAGLDWKTTIPASRLLNASNRYVYRE